MINHVRANSPLYFGDFPKFFHCKIRSFPTDARSALFIFVMGVFFNFGLITGICRVNRRTTLFIRNRYKKKSNFELGDLGMHITILMKTWIILNFHLKNSCIDLSSRWHENEIGYSIIVYLLLLRASPSFLSV